MRKLVLSAVLVVAALSPLACDLAKKATSDTVMVATLLSAPSREISPEAFAGVNAADAGIPVNPNPVTVPGSTAAFVFFGEFNGLDDPPSPIDGAEVTLVSSGGARVGLPEAAGGTYTKASGTGDDAELEYESGATYQFVANHDGDEYVGEVKDAPTLERIAQLDPPSGYVEHPANTAMTLTRPAPPSGQERNVGFVTVTPISATGEKGDTTYSNVPSTPLDFLKLFASSGEFKKDTVQIPASAFPQKDTTYLVIFQGARLGGPKSNNLQLASALMAGTAQVGVVRTK